MREGGAGKGIRRGCSEGKPCTVGGVRRYNEENNSDAGTKASTTTPQYAAYAPTSTSQPMSANPLAITLLPRSCPSCPIFATRMRGRRPAAVANSSIASCVSLNSVAELSLALTVSAYAPCTTADVRGSESVKVSKTIVSRTRFARNHVVRNGKKNQQLTLHD